MPKEVGAGYGASPGVSDPWTWLLDPTLTPITPRVTLPAGAPATISSGPTPLWGSALPASGLQVTATQPLVGSMTRPSGVAWTPSVPAPVAVAAPRYEFYDVMSEGMWPGQPVPSGPSKRGGGLRSAKPGGGLTRSGGGVGGVGGGVGAVPAAPGAVSEVPGDGGGGGGGGGGGTVEVVPDMLGELSWWANADVLQPLLRGWGGWLKELVEQNRLTQTIPNPFAFDPEAEAAGAEVTEVGAPAAAGYQSSRGVMDRLKTLLGVEFEAEETATSQWQKVINAIPKADFEAQQLLASLRFDPTGNQWYSVDIGALVNPKYT